MIRYLLAVMMCVFLASGIFMFGLGGRELLRKFARRGRFERADGVVLNVRRRTMRSTNRYRLQPMILNFPVVRFTARTGEAVTFSSGTGDTGKISRYSAGQRVPVRYDPCGEFAPMIDSWSGIWLPSLMAMLAGLGFIAGAILIGFAFGDRILGN